MDSSQAKAPPKADLDKVSTRTTKSTNDPAPVTPMAPDHLPVSSHSHAPRAACPPTTEDLAAEKDQKPTATTSNKQKRSSTTEQTETDEEFEMVQSEDLSSRNGSLVLPDSDPALPDPDKLMDELESQFKPTIPRSMILEDSESEDEKEGDEKEVSKKQPESTMRGLAKAYVKIFDRAPKK